MIARRRSALLLLALPGAVGWLLASRGPSAFVAPATACSCANGRAPDLYPYRGSEVSRLPRNPRLRLTPIWKLPGYDEWAADNGFDGARWNLELVRSGGAEVIPIEQRVVGAAEERVLEVWPKSALAPFTIYELRRAGGPRRTAAGFSTTKVTFETTGALDQTAPRWAGATAARFLPNGVSTTSSCGVGAPLVEIDVAEPTDDVTAPNRVVFAVWVQPPNTPVDLGRPPDVVTHHGGGKVHLGRSGYCSEANHHPKDEPTRFVLRALDEAGNPSPPSEVLLGAAPKATATATTPTAAPATSSSPPAPRRGGCGRSP